MRLDLRVSEIDLIESATQSIYEKKSNEWKSGLPVFWVNIEVKKEISSADFKMIAYFYDGNDKIIHKMNSVTSGHRLVSRSSWDSLFKTPTSFKKGENYQFHFLIPESIKFDSIKRAVLVYGVDKNYAWKAKPAVTLDSIEFDEKAQILESEGSGEN